MKTPHYLLVAFYLFAISAPFAPEAVQGEEKGFTLSPLITYAPETGVSGGVVAQVGFPLYGMKAGGRTARVRTTLLYTENDQGAAELHLDFPLCGPGCRLLSYLGYRKNPYEFYGIGNDTAEDQAELVEQDTAYTALLLRKAVGEGLGFGIGYLFSNNTVVFDDQGSFIGQDIPGEEGGLLSGLEFSLVLDRRDSSNFPRKGALLQFLLTMYDDIMGSDYEFVRLTFDARTYHPVFRSHAVALQLYWSLCGGEPPFFELPMLGGQYLMRGYYEGRYRDRALLAAQAEYRAPLLKRFGIVCFGGFGDVAAGPSAFELSEFKYSYGVGFRFYFKKRQIVPLRLDLAFGKDSNGVYLTYHEAF